MKVSLVVADGANRGKAIVFRGPVFLVGRDPACQLRAASEDVSRRHCEILVADGDVMVRDLGSRNGTFVNGADIGDEVVWLKNGDWLEVGPLRFVVRITAPEPEAAAEPTVEVEATAADAMAADAGADAEAPTRLIAPAPASPPSLRPPAKAVKPAPAPADGFMSKTADDLIRKMMVKRVPKPPGSKSAPG